MHKNAMVRHLKRWLGGVRDNDDGGAAECHDDDDDKVV